MLFLLTTILLSKISISGLNKFNNFDYTIFNSDRVDFYKNRNVSYGDIFVRLAYSGKHLFSNEKNDEGESIPFVIQDGEGIFYNAYDELTKMFRGDLSFGYLSNFSNKMSVDFFANTFFGGTSFNLDKVNYTSDIEVKGENISASTLNAAFGPSFKISVLKNVNIGIGSGFTALEETNPNLANIPNYMFWFLFRFSNDIEEGYLLNAFFFAPKSYIEFSFNPIYFLDISPIVSYTPFISVPLEHAAKADIKHYLEVVCPIKMVFEPIENFKITFLNRAYIGCTIEPVSADGYWGLKSALDLSYNIWLLHFRAPLIFNRTPSLGEGDAVILLNFDPNINLDWEFARSFYLSADIGMDYNFANIESEVVEGSSKNEDSTNKQNLSVNFFTSPFIRYGVSIRYDTRA